MRTTHASSLRSLRGVPAASALTEKRVPRFVLLEHDHPHRHWDLMFETAGVLKTWRLEHPPSSSWCEAEPLTDHRIAYLDYEGPVSGNRGLVRRVDTGTYQILDSTDTVLLVDLMGIHGPQRLRLEASTNGWRCRLEMVD